MPLDKFSAYWFQNFAAIMLLGSIESADQVVEGKDWSKECLGSFYIKPNYPGRSSHVCNAGFLVTDASRNRGVGRLMGETYLIWAPRLGYSYSVFNLVYETNVASCRIWDALGFKRIGRVKGCGNLKSYPDRLVDAIIYGRELSTSADGETASDPLLVSEERFDKIKFYLKHGRYPNGSDRAEKSRLRSAATHYKLLDNDVLMLKDKEVISDPIRQMQIARDTHEVIGHAGINKTTAVIAEKYHWSRIKETVSDVIRTCTQCKDSAKTATPLAPASLVSRDAPAIESGTAGDLQRLGLGIPPSTQLILDALTNDEPGEDLLGAPYPDSGITSMNAGEENRMLSLDSHYDSLQHRDTQYHSHHHHDIAHLLDDSPQQYANPSDISSLLNPPLAPIPEGILGHSTNSRHLRPHHSSTGEYEHSRDHLQHHSGSSNNGTQASELHSLYHPIDPRIIAQPTPSSILSSLSRSSSSFPHPGENDLRPGAAMSSSGPLSSHADVHDTHAATAGRRERAAASPKQRSYESSFLTHELLHDTRHDNAEIDPDDSFQSLLHDPDSVMLDAGPTHHISNDQAAVDRDLEMLLHHDEDTAAGGDPLDRHAGDSLDAIYSQPKGTTLPRDGGRHDDEGTNQKEQFERASAKRARSSIYDVVFDGDE
ncbi:uncharacterized protein B0I36DRAFT_363792 [Microdochium trichocladiopsis]|uniref:N-acetyltransferase domain-containing protein n=1 Tax=Microdochium trichocladiopsis TaxID=1682393 RepID=A0A9P8Y3X7_9PEZI|nr:uncharacterized protein B0I36DRAFT_363792 [Microdochium trichocladiopsis]KAH7029221.1 hypothetical protein B0I36DRAFT_363792 [Microdochium trichocladiopsis]